MNAEQIIKMLNMKPLEQEGGYYVETYRSRDRIGSGCLPSRYDGARNIATAIYYLLTAEDFSAMHRVKSDEIFHFYAGDAVKMLLLDSDGGSEVITLGSDIAAGQRPQVFVPAYTWQGCRVESGGQFALLGTTVSPGFEFEDFEKGSRAELTRLCPDQAELITELTLE